MESKFQCIICFEAPVKPVVTTCGHLYCWECIYNWLNTDRSSSKCPSCNSALQNSDIIPICNVQEEKEPSKGIPERPKPRWNQQRAQFPRPQTGAQFSFSAGFGVFPGVGFQITANPDSQNAHMIGSALYIFMLLFFLLLLFQPI